MLFSWIDYQSREAIHGTSGEVYHNLDVLARHLQEFEIERVSFLHVLGSLAFWQRSEDFEEACVPFVHALEVEDLSFSLSRIVQRRYNALVTRTHDGSHFGWRTGNFDGGIDESHGGQCRANDTSRD